jgi:ribosome biogenesis protein Nip4
VKGKNSEAGMADRRGVYGVFVGRPDGKRPLERPRRRWEDNIEMDLQEVGRGNMDWIAMIQIRDRWLAIVNAVMNLRVP